MLLDPAETCEVKPHTARKVAEGVLRWFAEIRAVIFKPTRYVLRPSHSASPEKPAQTAALTPEAVVTSPVATDVNVGLDAKIDGITESAVGTQEIERRRNLVRTLFNDFWTGAHDKPAAFVQRLDQAEDYLNERLAANGEFWRLDAKTRVMLGLPRRSNSNDGQ